MDIKKAIAKNFVLSQLYINGIKAEKDDYILLSKRLEQNAPYQVYIKNNYLNIDID